MARESVALQAFNRGRISRLALARTDLKRTALSAEVQTNWMPRTLGSMMLRPGLEHLGSTRANAAAFFIPFVFSATDTALIEITEGAARVWIDDAVVARPAVSTAITNGGFDANVSGWTDDDQSGATSQWASGGHLSLVGTGFNAAIRRQLVTVASADRGVEHGLRVVVERGTLTLKVGATSGSDSYIAATLTAGTHSLAFTPTDNFYIELSALTAYATLVSSCTIEAAGAVELPAPWDADDMGLIRTDQSADVIYLACAGYLPRKIERRAIRSWSLVLYQPDDGPFRPANLGTVSLTPSAITGDITLTASAPLFKPDNDGSLFRITSIGQTVQAVLSGEDQYTDHVRVTGIDSQRIIDILSSGSYSGTLTLQRSVSDPGAWVDVSFDNTSLTYNDGSNGSTLYYRVNLTITSGTATITLKTPNTGTSSQQVSQALASSTATNYITVTGSDAERTVTVTTSGTWAGSIALQQASSTSGPWSTVSIDNFNNPYLDNLNNQVIYYRVGFKPGDYTSGSVTVTLDAENGGITGVVRITDVTGETTATATVLKTLGGTSSSTEWSEGLWSDRRGHPSAVALHGGRLWWAGKNRIIGSVSDAYESFDPDTEGDSGPINRTIGQGPVDDINWMISLQRLMLGTASAEVSVKSSSFDEPITPTVFSLAFPSTQGSGRVGPVKVDATGLFVQRGGTRVLELVYDEGTYDYRSGDRTVLVPEIGEPSILRLGVQRQPDTRVHAVRSDGTVAVLVSDPAEDVSCWVEVETDGDIEDVVVLPGTVEDAVYYVVRRTIDGDTVRYLERWALESECRGGTLNRQADSFAVYQGSATATITGLDHLEGAAVIVWADGIDLSPDDENGQQTTFTVSGGQITLPASVSAAVVGLPYRARYKSTKLAYAAQGGTALGRSKRINQLGLILANTHARGVKYGPDFDTLDDLPLMEEAAAVDGDTIHEHFDHDLMEFPGDWNTDSRLCLEAKAPRPATVLAAIVDLQTHG